MPKALLRHLWMHTCGQQLRRMAVPEVMETDPRNVLHSACDLGEFMGKASRRHGIAIRATEGQRLAGLTNAER